MEGGANRWNSVNHMVNGDIHLHLYIAQNNTNNINADLIGSVKWTFGGELFSRLDRYLNNIVLG